MALVHDLIARQVHFYPATVDMREAEQNRDEFDALLALGILERAATLTHRICPTCGGEALEVRVVSDTRAYTLCTMDEAAARDYFSPEELKQWILNTPRLLSLFQEALGITTPQADESVEGLLWDLGAQTVNGVVYHLFFCRNFDEVGQQHLLLITAYPHSVVCYSGTLRAALSEKMLLVSLTDLIKRIDRTIMLEKSLVEQYFPKGVYATKDGDLELDDSMVLQGDYVLFEPLRGGVYQRQSEKIRPLGRRIIAHLYSIRKYPQNAKTLGELVLALSSTKRSVSNEIRRVQKLCFDNGLKEILHKFSGDKWGLNPHLKCCT